ARKPGISTSITGELALHCKREYPRLDRHCNSFEAGNELGRDWHDLGWRAREQRGSPGYVRLAEGLKRASDSPHAGTPLVGDLAPGEALGAEFRNLVTPEYRPRPADVLSVCPRSGLAGPDRLGSFVVLHLGVPGLDGPQELAQGGVDRAGLRFDGDHRDAE